MSAIGRRPLWVYAIAVTCLLACLWVGWADFTPWMPREAVQVAIRCTIRRIIQMLVQFAIPAVLVVFLVSEGATMLRARRKT